MTFDLIIWKFYFHLVCTPIFNLFSTLSASSIAQDQVFQTCTSTPPGLAHRARTHCENMLQCPTLPLKNVRQRQHLIPPPPTHTKLFFKPTYSIFLSFTLQPVLFFVPLLPFRRPVDFSYSLNANGHTLPCTEFFMQGGCLKSATVNPAPAPPHPSWLCNRGPPWGMWGPLNPWSRVDYPPTYITRDGLSAPLYKTLGLCRRGEHSTQDCIFFLLLH